MTAIHDIQAFLARLAPSLLAAEWDNVGLLVGDPSRRAGRIMTCLTVTPASAAEAVRERVDLIITHHPLPFRAVKQLTTETVTGRLLLQLIESGIAVHSSHTAFDSARDGINERLAKGLGLIDIRPLVAAATLTGLGAGRYGRLETAESLGDCAARVKKFLGLGGLHRVGPPDKLIRGVAVACGSAGDFLDAARQVGCDLFITGEARFHTCLEAEATGMALLLPGHFASERFGMEHLASVLAAEFPDVEVWASKDEADPLSWV